MTQMASFDDMALAHAGSGKVKRLELDEKMPMRFYMGSIQDAEASKKEGRPIFRDVPFIEIWIPGDKDNVIRRQVWDEPHMENSDTARWPKQWADFKAGREQAVVGTPVDKLPGITEGQCRELAFFHIRTVEHLAAMADEHAGKSMGLVDLKQRAQAWLEAARGHAPLEMARAALEEERAQRQVLEERLAALEQLQAETPKRGPGRPPKVHTEA